MRRFSLSVAASILAATVAAQGCPQGQFVTVTQDSITAALPIGFAFPFDGMTYTHIHISDHGICFLTNAGVPATPTATPLVWTPASASLVANGPVICPHWSDSIPGANGMFMIDAQPAVCTVTWIDIQSFGISPIVPMSMQLKLHITGSIEFFYGPNVTNNSTFGGVSDNGIVGVSPGTPAALPAPSDFVTSPTTNDPTFFEEFLTPNGFDMAGATLRLDPAAAGPGWVATFIPGLQYGVSCATKESFGQGCYDVASSSFYEEFANVPIDLAPGTSFVATSTGVGYVVVPGGNNWFTPTSTPLVIGDEQVLQQPLGFSFPYPGGSTSDIWIGSNGFVSLEATTDTRCCAGSGAGLLAGTATWAGFWDDLNPAAGGTVSFDIDPTTGTAYVTFDQVPRFATTDVNTFQYCFDTVGGVELRYQACAANTGTVAIGFSPGNGSLDPGAIDLSATSVILTMPDVPALALDAGARPILGTAVNMTISNIPTGAPIAAVIYGLVKHDPGISLASIGMPGCFQFGSQDAVALIIAPGNTASNLFTSPNSPAFAGTHIIVTGGVYNPAGGHNALNALSSNGVDLGLDIN